MTGPFNINIRNIVNNALTRRQIRSGVTTSVVEEFAESRADRIVSTNIAQAMRARDIVVTGSNFKPNTPYFVFFDGIAVNEHMTPTSSTYGMGGATAKGTALRSDNLGDISATFSIPNTDNLSFSTGTKTLKITSDSSGNAATSEGQANYAANGEIRIMQEEITSTRNGRVVVDEVSDTREQVRYTDPLAQSFVVDKKGGIFVSSVELYFGAKDTALPVWVQLRHMENGMPTQKIVPFGEKSLSPSAVNTSADASSTTKFSFPSPVFLESGREYCVVVMTNSNVYTSWVSEMGQKDIATNDFIDQQPYAGSLFKSQNNTTWNAVQSEDLKFTMKKCDFTSGSGIVTLQNDNIGDEVTAEDGSTLVYGQKLGSNPIILTNSSTVVRVKHADHGMYSTSNNVTITGVSSGVSTTLNGAITASGTSVTLTSNTNFPSSGTVHIKIDNEIMSGTISSSTISSITRGQ